MKPGKTHSNTATTGRNRVDRMGAILNTDPKLLRGVFPLLWFTIAAFLLFGQTIGFSYTYLDDQTLILNHMEQLKSGSAILQAFAEDAFHSPSGEGYYYRPSLTLSFIADAMIGGGSFAMFHITNILLHILVTFLLFLFLIKFGSGRIWSFLFALLYLVHPMTVQAVSWVPGRNDSLLAIFVLGAFLAWIKYIKTKKTSYLILHLFLFAAAMFTKENALVLPILILGYTQFISRQSLKKSLIPAVGWIVISAIWLTMRQNALGSDHNVPLLVQLASMVKNIPAVLPFLGKSLFPFNLSVFPILADMKISIVFGICAIIVLASLIFLAKPKNWPIYLFGFAWFLAFLVPSFVSINRQIPNFSEHRDYLSLAGIFLVVMACLPTSASRIPGKKAIAALSGMILVFATLSFLHSRNFKDQFAFWQNAVDSSPSHAFNYNNLGAMYFLKGDLQKAEPLFRKALKVNRYEPMANSNTGLVCMRTNRPAEAETYYLEEIRINPAYLHSYYNLGLLYFNYGRYNEAIPQWEKVLRTNPGYTDVYPALMAVYKQTGRTADYNRILQLVKEQGVK